MTLSINICLSLLSGCNILTAEAKGGRQLLLTTNSARKSGSDFKSSVQNSSKIDSQVPNPEPSVYTAAAPAGSVCFLYVQESRLNHKHPGVFYPFIWRQPNGWKRSRVFSFFNPTYSGCFPQMESPSPTSPDPVWSEKELQPLHTLRGCVCPLHVSNNSRGTESPAASPPELHP